MKAYHLGFICESCKIFPLIASPVDGHENPHLFDERWDRFCRYTELVHTASFSDTIEKGDSALDAFNRIAKDRGMVLANLLFEEWEKQH